MALTSDVKNAINKQAPRLIKNQLMSAARIHAEKIKGDLIAEFLEHPVTRELAGGPDATNISGTLGGRGNLFTFIGFDDSYDPIAPILLRLQEIQAIFGGYTSSGIQVIVTIPDPKEIFEITPLPWAEGRSWAKSIEQGLSGLGFYLLKKGVSSSRSGGAIQSESRVLSGVKFKPTQYISALLKKYNTILNINETIISA